MTLRRVLVTGGSGFVGRSLCEKLARRDPGGQITVPTRNLMRAAALKALPTVDLVDADLYDDAALAALVAGQDAVVHLVAVLHGDEARFRRVHVELPRRLAAACAAAGVRRVVHISALGVAEGGPNAPSMYLRSKTEGEAVLRASGLDVTVLRPSVMFGARDKLLNTFAKLQALLPVVPLAAADAQFQPVWVEDVAEAIARCLDRPAPRVVECAGPDVMTLREIVQRAGEWSGHPRPVWGLPNALARVQAALMALAPGEPLMSKDNLDSMSVPNIATGKLPGLAALGIAAASLAQVGPTYLGGDDGCARLDPMRARRG